MPLRLAEAHQLHDGLTDPLLRPALEAFFQEQRLAHLSQLIRAIRQKDRDTMHEAALAGKVDAYETALAELDHFSKRMLEESKVYEFS